MALEKGLQTDRINEGNQVSAGGAEVSPFYDMTGFARWRELHAYVQ